MKRSRSRRGLTLVELLVTMGVTAILAAITVSAMSSAQAYGDRSKAISNMRVIGTGIRHYAAEKDGVLPGPLWPGQVAEFDPNRAGRLVRELAPYLDIETPAAPKIIDLFVPPSYRKETKPAALGTARIYVMNMAISEGNTTLNPWGSLAANDGSRPARMATIPGGAWAFSDADQLHPKVIGASWATNTPAKPIHGKRLAWFFNGSVSQVEERDLQ